VDVHVGTSGYSYKEWKGRFYPEKIPGAEMLAFYARTFSTVEINNTFYRMPAAALLERWAAETPDGFTFVLKAPQRITHQKRLGDAAAEVSYFLETAGVLGPKRGPVLYQLPPHFRKDLARLRGFLDLLPPEPRAAFEFRHDSWFDEEVYQALRERGAALCHADADGDTRPAADLPATADWGYLRLRKVVYGEDDLQAWASRVKAQAWGRAFVFFKHEDEATGPALASRFKVMLAG
jgi:uncharacterized protein YecE (DUF72 family)